MANISQLTEKQKLINLHVISFIRQYQFTTAKYNTSQRNNPIVRIGTKSDVADRACYQSIRHVNISIPVYTRTQHGHYETSRTLHAIFTNRIFNICIIPPQSRLVMLSLRLVPRQHPVETETVTVPLTRML